MAEVLVAYFSATGTTGAVAASLSDAIEADLTINVFAFVRYE